MFTTIFKNDDFMLGYEEEKNVSEKLVNLLREPRKAIKIKAFNNEQ